MGDALALLSPQQVGYGVKRGSEGTIHALRAFLTDNENTGFMLLKIDFKNAFNSVRRDCFLSYVKQGFPGAAPFVYNCYSTPSALFWQEDILDSAEGVQQGDPLGPFLFCLSISELVKKLKSKINVWYLDDGTIVGDIESVVNDFGTVVSEAAKLGLEVNPSKCECSILSQDPAVRDAGFARIASVAPEIRRFDNQEVPSGRPSL